jgi:excisionase family DNA binding protein
MKQAEFLTSREVATLLRKSHPSVCRLLRDGKLPGIQVGRGWLCPKQSLDQMLKGTPEPTAPRSRRRAKTEADAQVVAPARAKKDRLPRQVPEMPAEVMEQLRLALEEIAVAHELAKQQLVDAQKAVRRLESERRQSGRTCVSGQSYGGSHLRGGRGRRAARR